MAKKFKNQKYDRKESKGIEKTVKIIKGIGTGVVVVGGIAVAVIKNFLPGGSNKA